MNLNITAVVSSIFFFSCSTSSLFAVTDCPHSISLKDLRALVDKKTGDSFVNSKGEKWTMGSEGSRLKIILDYLEDPRKVNLTIGTRLTGTHHEVNKPHHGADLTETLSCAYTVSASGPNTNNSVELTIKHTLSD